MPNKHILLKRIQPEENLYHYTKCRGVQGILKDKAFFATKSDFLNDTNEMRYTLALTRDVLTEFPILEEHSSLRQQLLYDRGDEEAMLLRPILLSGSRQHHALVRIRQQHRI